MLSSIHPLGERGRNSNYALTVSSYVVGSVVGGLATGTMLGFMGRFVGSLGRPSDDVIAGVVLAVALIGVALDLRVGGLSLPSYHRQVNEDWLTRYRGWVYGSGFGLQLGAGFATIVPTAGIYATFFLAFVSGSIATGALIEVTFGLVRSVMILMVAGVDTPEALRSAHRRLSATGRWAHRTVVGAQGLMAVVMIGVLLWQ